MLIFPAIDLLDGKVVRLYQGDFKNSLIFSDDPVSVAGSFVENGAGFLHIVDLDGAKASAQKNFMWVERIASAFPGLFIQLGGGIRDLKTVEKCLSAGVSRIIIGTSALRDIEFTKSIVNMYDDRIAIGVDARNMLVAIEGWLYTSDDDSIEFCRRMADIGVKYIIYTDIAKDGTGKGVDLKLYEELKKIEGVSFIASGGISSYAELEALRDIGMYAAILGKSLYSGIIDLKEAIKTAKK